jgi:hypothetical protein
MIYSLIFVNLIKWFFHVTKPYFLFWTVNLTLPVLRNIFDVEYIYTWSSSVLYVKSVLRGSTGLVFKSFYIRFLGEKSFWFKRRLLCAILDSWETVENMCNRSHRMFRPTLYWDSFKKYVRACLRKLKASAIWHRSVTYRMLKERALRCH